MKPVFLIQILILFTTMTFVNEAMSLSVWVPPPLAKVLRDAMPPAGDSVPLVIEGARNETASAQLALRSTADVQGVTAIVSDLKHQQSDAILPADTVMLHWERYILINRNSDLPEDELVAKAPNSIPDPFWEGAAIPLRANEAQALWIDAPFPMLCRACTVV